MMKKNKNKKLLAFIFATMLILSLSWTSVWHNKVSAAPVSIYVSSASGQIGSTITINISISSDDAIIAGGFLIGYDPSVISYEGGSGDVGGGNGSLNIVNTGASSYSLNFECVGVGSTSISISRVQMSTGNDVLSQVAGISNGYVTVSPIEDSNQPSSDSDQQPGPDSNQGADKTENNANADQSQDESNKPESVTGADGKEYSTVNTLKSLSVSPGQLSSAFNEKQLDYNVEVNDSVDRLVVSAIATDSKASVTVSDRNLKMGENTISIKVVAESGSSKTYTLHVYKGVKANETEAAQTFTSARVTLDGLEYVIARKISEPDIPDGFAAEKGTYKGQEIALVKGFNGNVALAYLVRSDGEWAGLCVYDEKNELFAPYRLFIYGDIRFIILPLEGASQVPSGMKETSLDIDGLNMKVFMDEKNKDYCIFYGADSKGHLGLFTYDLENKTIQRYFASGTLEKAPEKSETKADVESSSKNMALITAWALAGIFFIIAGFASFLAYRNHKKLVRARLVAEKIFKEKAADNLDIFEADELDDNILADDFKDESLTEDALDDDNLADK